MSGAPKIDAADLPPDVRKRLGVRRPRRSAALSMDRVRGRAINVLHVISDLSQAERRRVLRQAVRLNDL